jgi:pimeloyl-ACP methyl ester carboxylesterase
MPELRGAIVLLHGVASNRTRWSEFLAATALRGSWRLLAPDLRGHGEAVDRGRIGMDEWCADLVALLGRERLARAVVAGHCLGANVALHFAALHPERTAGLVLIEPMPPEALTGKMKGLSRLRFVLGAMSRLVRGLNALGLHRSRIETLDLEQLDRETRRALARGPEGERELARYASPLADLRTTATAVYLQDLLAVTAPLPPAQGIAAPALALLSGHSAFTDPARTRSYLEKLPDGDLVTLPAKHWIPTEQPRAMREAIEAWVARRFPRGI